MTRFEQLQAFRDLYYAHGLILGLWLIALGGLILIDRALVNAWERRQRRRGRR